jgi:hypothetical protein
MVMIVVKLTRYVDGDHDDGCEVNYGDMVMINMILITFFVSNVMKLFN